MSDTLRRDPGPCGGARTAPSEAGAASGLSNMLRNLGGAVGTATLATVLTKREQFHSNIIGQSRPQGQKITGP